MARRAVIAAAKVPADANKAGDDDKVDIVATVEKEVADADDDDDDAAASDAGASEDDYDAYELERQRTIRENEALLAQLGLEGFATSNRASQASSPAPGSSANGGSSSTRRGSKRRRAGDDSEDELLLRDGDSSRRRTRPQASATPAVATRKSSRLLGQTATTPAELAQVEQAAEEARAEMERERRAARKAREPEMQLQELVEEDAQDKAWRGVDALQEVLRQVGEKVNARPLPFKRGEEEDVKPSRRAQLPVDDDDNYDLLDDAAAAAKRDAREDARLREAFARTTLRAHAKVTQERVYCMTIHPEPTKSLVFVGDKRGQLGIWDALASAPESGDLDDDADEIVKPAVKASPSAVSKGSVWRVQAHAKSSISCLRVEPVAGKDLLSSSYDCTLRSLSLPTGQSTELFALDDADALITHFDMTPSGQEAWIVDSQGGLSHLDTREAGTSSARRRRYEISGERANRKIGGVSINPRSPWLVCTASNDRYLRIWDVRQLSSLKTEPYTLIDSAPDADLKESDRKAMSTAAAGRAFPQDECSYETLQAAQTSKKKGAARGILRGQSLHGKSCSSAYWDPWGQRILTTSYDDRLRIFDVRPRLFNGDEPLAKGPDAIVKTVHDCQTGRWVSVFKAQWSLNTAYGPHYTVGSMKRRICVYSGMTGKSLATFYDGEYVTSVPAVTALHPSQVSTVCGGNLSGKCQLWAAED